MPTLDSLKAAFEARADEATPVSDLLASLPPRHEHDPWARRGAVVAGVASAAAVAVIVTVTSEHSMSGNGTTAPSREQSAAHSRRPHPPAGPQPTRLQYTFSLGHVAGYELAYDQIDPTSQVADVSESGRADSPTSTGSTVARSIGDIRVYARGAFDPTEARKGAPVEVDGHPGYWANMPDPDTGDPPAGVDKRAVVWEYAPDSWAVVQGDWVYEIRHGYLDGNAEQLELSIANAVHTQDPTTARVPFKLTYLPAGLVPQNSGSSDASQAEIGLTDGGPPDTSMPGNTPGYGDAASVQANAYDPNLDLRQVDAHGNLHVSHQGGYTLRLGHPVAAPPGADRAFQDGTGMVNVLYPDHYVQVYFSGAKPQRVSDAELLKIAEGLRTSPHMNDTSTWFDALDATP